MGFCIALPFLHYSLLIRMIGSSPRCGYTKGLDVWEWE